jgi:hypothetical protein
MDRGLRIVLADRHQVTVLLLHANAARQLGIQLALGPLHVDHVTFKLHHDSLRERIGFRPILDIGFQLSALSSQLAIAVSSDS